MRHPARIKELLRPLQLLPAGHAEAEVIESDACLIEPISAGGTGWIGARADAEADRPITEEDTSWQIHDVLEAEHLGVERATACDITDCQPEMVHGARCDRRWHAALLLSAG